MKNGAIWPDTHGNPINAHGGGILYHDGTYYWYGEHKGPGWEGRLAFDGVHCYSSTDLTRWQDEGIVLPVVDNPDSPIHRGCRIERPKVIHCACTGQFVMWFHSTDANHMLARSGVATASSPTGPFTFQRSFRPDAGRWPLNVTDADKAPESIAAAQAIGEHHNNAENDRVRETNILGRDFENGQMARDQTLFVDDDGAAYHIFASENNSTLHIARLTDNYFDHAEYVRVFPGRWHEAPAIFKRHGTYFLLSSGCTSWDPNPARSASAPDMFGPWVEHGNPCTGGNPANGHGPDTTFGCQSTFVLHVHGADTHLAMFDQWQPKSFDDSRYVWLPIRFTDTAYKIPWTDDWQT